MGIIRNLTKRADEYLDGFLAEVIRQEIRRQLDGTGSHDLWLRCQGYIEERFDELLRAHRQLRIQEKSTASSVKLLEERLEEVDERIDCHIGLRRDGVRDDEGHRAPRGGV